MRDVTGVFLLKIWTDLFIFHLLKYKKPAILLTADKQNSKIQHKNITKVLVDMNTIK
jgi:hypothetical protein